MKKLILSILLGAGLILSGPALAVTKRSLMHANWLIEPGKSKDIPIDFKPDNYQHTDVIMISLDSITTNGNVQILWNGKAVPRAENLGPGDTTIFHIEENGTLTIKNLDNTKPAFGDFYLDN